MALTALQGRICRLLAEQRKASGESYVAEGGALNALLGGQRRSRDVDLFHDTISALVASWARDRGTLEAAGLAVDVLRERPAFVEAQVGDARRSARGRPRWGCRHGPEADRPRPGALALDPRADPDYG